MSLLRVAARWGPVSGAIIDDLVQETYVKLCADRCRLLLEFARRHPEAILGYVKTVAANVARDHFKALRSQKRGSGEVSQVPENSEAPNDARAFGAPDTIERELLLKEIDRCLDLCTAGPDRDRDRLVFWLYYQQGMTAKAIAALPTVGLTAKGVESAILRLTRLVREQLVGLRSQRNSARAGEGFHHAESY